MLYDALQRLRHALRRTASVAADHQVYPNLFARTAALTVAIGDAAGLCAGIVDDLGLPQRGRLRRTGAQRAGRNQ